MKRRDFMHLLTATLAAFLVSQYGMPGGGETPAESPSPPITLPMYTGNGWPIEIRSGTREGEIIVINHDTVPHDISFWL